MDNFLQASPKPATPVIGAGGISTLQDAINHRIYLQVPASHGKLCAVKLPTYEPVGDLLWTEPPVDNPATTNVDESTLMPSETWAKTNRPFLVNFGGNRVSVINQSVRFDASISQGDEDAIITDASWNFGDATTATGLVVRHTYTVAGTYAVTCTVMGQTSTRHIRVLNNLGESDWDITSLNSLSASGDSGWQASFLVQAATSNIDPFQGILLYVYDDTDISWRQTYDAAFRALARRTAYTSQTAPDPIWDISTVSSGNQNSSGSGGSTITSLAGIGNPSGGAWPAVNQWNSPVATNAARYNVPPNMAKAVMYLESQGDPNAMTATGNSTCPYAYGLFQIACGCAVVTCVSDDTAMLDAATNIEAGIRHLSINYASCNNSWDGAICQFFSGHCVPNGAADILGTTDYDYVNIVKQHWAECDAVTPAVGGGTDIEPEFGEVVFDGYVSSIETVDHKDGTDMTVTCVGSGDILGKLSIRREAFFESSQYGTYGGTIMDGPPMRIATCMHHILKVHTDFPDGHDVILDWSGPRMTSTTANEGVMFDAFKQWAHNDFALVWTDRHGALRYEPKPWYRGKIWFDAAVQKAALIDPTLVISADVTERTMDAKTSWVKLCGLLSNGSCEICGTYPCGNPAPGAAGNWAVQRGYQYDDYRTLCALAAHHYSYLNRRYDITFQIAWRHDLELQDLIQLPIKDKSGKFDWSNGRAPVFVITSISHQYNNTSATWLTTVQAQELTYGVPCDCPQPHCPKTVACPTCGSSQNSGGVTGGGGGSLVCAVSNFLDPGKWGTASLTTSSSDSTGSWGLGDLGNCPDCTHFRSVTVIHSGGAEDPPDQIDDHYTNQTICEQGGAFSSPESTDQTEDVGMVGTLSASFSTSGVVITGSSIANSTSQNETISWVDFVAKGPPGTSLILQLDLTVNNSSTGSGDLYLYSLDTPFNTEVTGQSSTSFSQLDFPSTFLTTISSTQASPSIFYAPCSLEGINYRLVLRSHQSDSTIISNTNSIQCQNLFDVNHGTTYRWGFGADGLASSLETFNSTRRYGLLGDQIPFNEEDDTGYIHETLSSPGGTLTYNSYRHNPFEITESSGSISPQEQYTISYHSETGEASISTGVTLKVAGCLQGSSIGTQFVGQQGSNGSYSFPPSTGGSVAGTCTGWPSVEKINARIHASELSNNTTSVLHDKGSSFITYAQQYSINPGVVVAILQRESQLASDGSTLPTTLNNFGGVTGAGTCGTQFITDRDWAKFCTPEDGLKAVFATLDTSLYRSTGGKLADIMNLYSPPNENNVADMWAIFGAVAADLAITLEPSTIIYSTSSDCSTPAGQLIAGPPPGQPGFGGYTTMLEYVMHQQNMQVSQGPFGVYSHSICDCYDMAVPIGTPIYPLIAGTVTISEATDTADGPNTIQIQTAEYGYFRYDHFSTRSVIVGQQVGLDTLIGYSGTAGTGAHLHLGLEGGVANSPKGYTLTQTMQAIGFNIGSFPWE